MSSRNCNCSCNCKHRKYETRIYPGSVDGEKTLLTGVRHVDNRDEDIVYISGFYVPLVEANTTGFVYKGCLCGNGHWHNLNHPPVNGQPTITNLYGPNNGKHKDTIQVVGNYTVQNQTGAFGCLYEGKLDGSGHWTTIIPPFGNVINTICHSTMGGLIVGNYDTNIVQGKAFIYDIKHKRYLDITNHHAVSITAYGIWLNSNADDDNCKDKDANRYYTICGGFTNKALINVAYLVDFDKKRGCLKNWRIYNYNNDPHKTLITHFDGITIGKDNKTYNLTGQTQEKGELIPHAFYAQVKRHKHNDKFKRRAKWCQVAYPHKLVTTGNTVYKKWVIGVYIQANDSSVDGYVSYVKGDL